ncbi:protein ITPRID2-like [Sitophilus oryzae]|uniref:Protein ITPRID2-like n=1 Tax=Sitophilus oryzae TaxID=7048 RepID=A0A6J2X663_SITOR|nr:protein ITPRID2-like [Sitophilus oryzae]XP_030764697.1 protein ITPRID2-like [Sitophilus oryzae]
MSGDQTHLMARQQSTLTQQWLDTLNTLQNNQLSQTQRSSVPNVYAAQQTLINRQKYLLRDSSFHSDDSHCSSVESVLELRKPDPEEVLLGLGFGPRGNSGVINKIPSRFLQPSKLIPQIDINKFMEQYGANLPESVPPSPAKKRPKSC